MTASAPASSLPAHLQRHLDAISIDAAISTRWPDYRVMAIVAHGIDQAAMAETSEGQASAPLARAEAAVRAQSIADWTIHPHIAQWMAAFTAFGAKPKRTSPSVLALLRRVDAGLPRIDPITDLYNAVSIAHCLPVGGEDLDAYDGAPRLTLASGDEPFDTIAQGEPVVEHPAPGEVIWRDDRGVTCRRWNWRQGVRTRIVPATTSVIFLIEALGAMTDEALLAAGADLTDGLRSLAPAVGFGSRMMGDGSKGDRGIGG